MHWVIKSQWVILLGKRIITIWGSHLWRSIGANGDGPNEPMVHPIAIGTNGDHHWWSLDPIKWIHWRHFVAMWLLKSPMIVNGTNDVIGVNGTIGDPLVQMAIHWCHWRQWRQWNHWFKWSSIGAIGVIETIGVNGTNDGIGASLAPLSPMELLSPLEPLSPLNPLSPLKPF